MIARYLVLFFVSSTITCATKIPIPQEYIADPKISCNITSLHEKKSKLLNRKEYVENKIQELRDKINNTEADASEPAKLKSFLNESNKIDRKLIRVERLLQKQLCRFL